MADEVREQLGISPAAAPASTLAEVRPDLADAADDYARRSVSDSSQRALRADWAVWSSWCAAQRLSAMPGSPDTAAGFLTDMADKKAVATLKRYIATVSKLDKLQGHGSPFADARVKAVLAGIKRARGVAQKQKKAITIEHAAASLGEGAAATRDRAVRLLGIATSFRGDDLRRLDVDDLRAEDAGIIVRLRRSKTDQEGRGRFVGVPRVDEAPEPCPVRATEAWLALRGAAPGPLFPGKGSDGRIARRTINRIVKRAAERAGLDPRDYGAHSLRSGFVTAARRAGLDDAHIMAQTGHATVDMVRRYDQGRRIDPFRASRVAEVFRAAARERKPSGSG
jgi:integrase